MNYLYIKCLNHLNITWAVGIIGFNILFWNVPQTTATLLGWLTTVPFTLWVLYHKNRSMAWIFLAWLGSPLWLTTKHTPVNTLTNEGKKRNIDEQQRGATKLAKKAGLLTFWGQPTEEYNNLIMKVTSKDKIADMTSEEAESFLDALADVVIAQEDKRVQNKEGIESKIGNQKASRRYLLLGGLLLAVAIIAVVAIRPMYWLGRLGFGGMMLLVGVSLAMLTPILLSVLKIKSAVKWFLAVSAIIFLIAGIINSGIILYESKPELNEYEVKTITNGWIRDSLKAVSAEYQGNRVWRVKIIGEIGTNRYGNIDIYYSEIVESFFEDFNPYTGELVPWK